MVRFKVLFLVSPLRTEHAVETILEEIYGLIMVHITTKSFLGFMAYTGVWDLPAKKAPQY